MSCSRGKVNLVLKVQENRGLNPQEIKEVFYRLFLLISPANLVILLPMLLSFLFFQFVVVIFSSAGVVFEHNSFFAVQERVLKCF